MPAEIGNPDAVTGFVDADANFNSVRTHFPKRQVQAGPAIQFISMSSNQYERISQASPCLHPQVLTPMP